GVELSEGFPPRACESTQGMERIVYLRRGIGPGVVLLQPLVQEVVGEEGAVAEIRRAELGCIEDLAKLLELVQAVGFGVGKALKDGEQFVGVAPLDGEGASDLPQCARGADLRARTLLFLDQDEGDLGEVIGE